MHIADTTIECTVHWLADGREGQRDLILRSRPIVDLIPSLVERLGLREHTDGPTQSVATLHPRRDAPSFAENSTLAEGGVRDGDQIWLILTPTFLPATVHWSANGRSGEQAALLPAAQTVGAQIAALIDDLGLRELVDGPVKAVATLRPASDASAWDEAQTLLDLDVRIGAHIWLDLAPRFMPVTLHWNEDGQALQKHRYLAIKKTIGEHIDDLIGLLGVESEINGPSKSVASLHVDPKRSALPAAQTLPQAGVRADDHLWFMLTPTFVTVTVHYSAGETTNTRKLTVPRTRSLQEIGVELSRQLGLVQPGASKITLHPAATAPAWPSAATLADKHVDDGHEIWLKIAPLMSAARLPRWATIVGGSAIGLILLILLGLAWQLWGGRSLGASAPTTIALPTATPVPATPTPTPKPTTTSTPLPPTPTPSAQQDPDYALGQQALASKDWLGAIAAFERVRGRYPNDAEINDILAMAYYGQAESSLTGPNTTETVRGILRQTFTYSPTYQLGHTLEGYINLYQAGIDSAGQNNWPEAIKQFEQLHGQKPDFLDVTQRLYGAYMAYGTQLEQQNNVDLIPAARDAYTKAAALLGIDVSAAQARMAALTPQLRAIRISQDGAPNCIEIRIDGAVDFSNWHLYTDGIGASANIDPTGVVKECRLRNHQGVTARIVDAQGQTIPGGDLGGRRGGDIVAAPWR